jgi:hypothetical protein
VEDGLGNFIIEMKYWHERMVMHTNVHNKDLIHHSKYRQKTYIKNNKKQTQKLKNTRMKVLWTRLV